MFRANSEYLFLGLTTLETTLFIYNMTSMYTTFFPQISSDFGHDPHGSVWEPARVMVANRLATNGEMWTKIFAKYNSGTYNNQWMVVDHKKKAERGGQGSNLLWIHEQLPIMTTSSDKSDWLNSKSQYFASYNRALEDPFNNNIRRLSGAVDMESKYGDWFSYFKTPRALLFEEKNDFVVDVESMMTILRSNDFQVHILVPQKKF